jgi:hypothetical protein
MFWLVSNGHWPAGRIMRCGKFYEADVFPCSCCPSKFVGSFRSKEAAAIAVAQSVPMWGREH